MVTAVSSVTLSFSSGGWSGHTFRYTIKAPKVIGGGAQIRVTLKAGTNGFSIGDVYIGKQTGANVMADQVRLKFGGNNGVTCPGGQTVTSDWVDFPFTSGQPLIVSAYFNGASDVARNTIEEPDNYALHFKEGVNEAFSSSPTGYTSGTPDRIFVYSVEAQGAEEEPEPEPEAELPVVRGKLTRPTSVDCLAGTVPTLPSFTPYDVWLDANAEYGRRQDELTADGGAILVFGDSSIACMNVAPYWSPFAQNYGINGDTIAGLLNRLTSYTAIHNCAGVIVQLGVNDIGVTSPNMTQIKADAMKVLNWLSGPLVWIAITPTTNATWNTNIADFNAYIDAQLASRAHCVRVNVNSQLVDGSGLLKEDCRLDLEHLNTKGKRIVSAAVRSALLELGIA